MSSGERSWLRSRGARALLAAALLIPLVLGGLFLAVGKLHSSPTDSLDRPAHPVSDEQTQAEVVEPAKEFVSVARLQKPTAGYLLMSCKDRENPPYQGAVYLTFAVYADARADTYFEDIATAMVAHGWEQGLPPNQHAFGRTLRRGGVTAILYRDDDYPNLGVVRLYGQCRNTNDHRSDTTGWVDVTSQVR